MSVTRIRIPRIQGRRHWPSSIVMRTSLQACWNFARAVTYPFIMLLPIHIVAGGLAIILGGVALVASKGAWLHRRSGLLFVYAMLTMGFSGSILAILKSWTNANVLGGFMSAYFVVTGLTTVRPVSVWTRRLNMGALVVAIALCLVEIGLGFKAFGSPGGAIDGAPFFMMFIMATVVGLAAGR